MHAVERAVLAALRGPCAAAPGQKGLLAVSGGPDSIALLRAMLAVQSRLPMRLEVVHFDHGLRPESPHEAAWVAARARAAELPFHLRRATHLAALSHGVQAAARAWRQDALLKLQVSTGADWIATGHQQDDHLETLLLKLLRGAHLSRLRGMDWRTGPFIRPLLGISRADLQDYLRALSQDWLTDPSNASDKYLRNRVRNELMPLLGELAGGAAAARLTALDTQSRQLAAWLEKQPQPSQGAGSDTPWLGVASLRRLPPIVQGYALERFIQRYAPGELAANDIAQALALLDRGKGPKQARWTLHLSAGRVLERKGARLVLSHRVLANTETTRQALDDVRVLAPSAWRVEGGRGNNGRGPGLLIANIPLGAELTLRMRHEGDRFHPEWKTHPVKLKDFLRDQHVPLWERDELPLVVCNGTVIAIYPRFVAHGHNPGNSSLPPNPGALLSLKIFRIEREA